MEVAGEVEVDVLHGDHLGIAAAGRSAFHTKDRAQGGFPQADHRPFADSVQGIGQPYRGGGFSLASGSGADGGDQYQLGPAGQVLKGADVHLCLIAAIGFQHVFCQSQFRCDLLNGEHGCALGDLDITFHVHNRASIHKNYKRSETGGECRVLTFVTLMDPGLPDHQ